MNKFFEINLEETATNIQNFIKTEVTNANFSDVVIGISGGVDSALSVTLAVRALGANHVHVCMLPYGQLNQEGVIDANDLIQTIKIPQQNIYTINIQPSVDVLLNQLEDITDIRKGNIMARVRMIYLYDLAKKTKSLVLGTENKSEHFLGYFTRFGDEASDIEPIRSLYKTQVWELAKYVGVPESIILKAPTAGLWSEQTDEKELGFTYKDADVVLYAHFEKHMTEAEIETLGISKETIQHVLQRVNANDFKHHLPKIFS